MKTLFSQAHRSELLERLANLDPARRPLWGRMTASQMVAHVSTALRLSLGESLDRRPKGVLAYWPVNWLTIYVLPWPKGRAQSPPELLRTEPGDWDADVAGLRRLVDEFGERDPRGRWPESVAFGKISGKTWGVLQYKHLNHHFSQFGI